MFLSNDSDFFPVKSKYLQSNLKSKRWLLPIEIQLKNRFYIFHHQWFNKILEYGMLAPSSFAIWIVFDYFCYYESMYFRRIQYLMNTKHFIFFFIASLIKGKKITETFISFQWDCHSKDKIDFKKIHWIKK